ncbi:HEPN domain-containing protein [Legionella dresdenensis]|uniref:HEPN domain-containing protein n=1 Tax=Legionella dresdenensis TaxID=450200 RepID=A0ABV8CDA6_9GAMM
MKNKQRGKWDAKLFIRNASKFLEAGNKLSSDLNYLDISSLLGHLAIEQLLKGFLIWDEKEAPRIHFVYDLSKLIGFNLGKELESKLRKIDTFFNRYPLDEEEWEKTRKQLAESNYQSVKGIDDLPGESSTMDWDLILEIWCELVQLWIQDKFPMELNDVPGIDSIAIRYPSILLEWDFDNNKFSPITVNYTEQISWKCKKNHLSQASLKEYYNRGCKDCSPKFILPLTTAIDE